ncbi:hypothetical protein ACQEVZ_03285 [Dactylosporangium sp. CA-152071]|uniref:hypothetical protein n=1 Tax=Dactylosporangium sp. CA-152071 TaxID=3239933 RepID=UPI003D8DC9A0
MPPRLPVILALVVPAAVVTVAVGGRFGRHLRLPGHTAAQVAIGGCVAGDVLLLAALLNSAHVGWAASAAGAASAARLVAAALAGRRLVRLRAAAN